MKHRIDEKELSVNQKFLTVDEQVGFIDLWFWSCKMISERSTKRAFDFEAKLEEQGKSWGA